MLLKRVNPSRIIGELFYLKKPADRIDYILRSKISAQDNIVIGGLLITMQSVYCLDDSSVEAADIEIEMMDFNAGRKGSAEEEQYNYQDSNLKIYPGEIYLDFANSPTNSPAED